MGFDTLRPHARDIPGHENRIKLARRLRSNILETRTQTFEVGAAFQAVLVHGRERHLRRLSPGAGILECALCRWQGRQLDQEFAIADDHEDGDGTNVLNFWQAVDKAKALARGSDADAGRPTTVERGADRLCRRSEVRGGGATNASQPRHHRRLHCWRSRSAC